MSSGDAPDWDLLDEDLAAFFGLSPGHGRRELKLAYAALIKIYKPEQRPAEFQVIRAAYDALDARLRGQAPQRALTHSEARRPTHSPTPEVRTAVPREASAPPRPACDQSREALLALLAASGPELVYERLRDLRQRTPLAFEWLAFLSDVVPGDSAAGELEPFLRWLSLGLAEYPGHRGLLELLRHRCRQPQPVPDIAHLLASLAAGLAADDFAYVSEPLWRQLLEQAPFADFAALHVRFVRSIAFAQSPATVTLRTVLLRAALWRAPSDWVLDEWTWVLERQELTGDLELDLLEALHEYRLLRASAGRAQGELHEAIEQVARAACDQDEARAETLFLALQARIADDPDVVLSSFPRGDATAGAVLALLDAIALQFAIPARTTAANVDREALQARALAMLKRVHVRSWISPRALLWQLCFGSFAVLGLLFLVAGSCVLIGSGIALLPENARRHVMIVAVCSVVALIRHSKRLLVDRLWAHPRQRLAEHLYHLLARRDVLRLLRHHNAGSDSLDQVLRTLPGPTPTAQSWLLIGLATDPLPALYAFALRFA